MLLGKFMLLGILVPHFPHFPALGSRALNYSHVCLIISQVNLFSQIHNEKVIAGQ
jgi:hypothetical protein